MASLFKFIKLDVKTDPKHHKHCHINVSHRCYQDLCWPDGGDRQSRSCYYGSGSYPALDLENSSFSD